MLTSLLEAFTDPGVDYNVLVDTIARKTAEIMRCFCVFNLISDDHQWLKPVATYDVDPAAREKITALIARSHVPAQAPQLRPILVEGKSFHSSALDATWRELRFPDPADREIAAALEMKSLLGAPLRVRGRIIGAVSLLRHGASAPPFDNDDTAFAQSLADHAALAIANARLVDDLHRELAERERMAARLEVSSEIARQLSEATTDLDRVLSIAARRLAEVLGEACSIRLLDASGQFLDPAGATHHIDPARAQKVALLLNHPQRVGEGIAGQAALTGKSALIASIETEELAQRVHEPSREIVRDLGIRGVLAVPLSARGEILGVVVMLRSGTVPRFEEEDLRVVENVAAHAAMAISNNRLIASLLRTEEQLRHAQKMDAIGRVAGGVAHDFNNVLSVVLSYSQLLIAQVDAGDPMRADLQEIERAGLRAAGLSRQLLAFSHQQPATPQIVVLGEIVTGMKQMLRRLIGEHIELRISHAPDLGKTKADPGQLEQVVMNLAVNARDAMPRGGALTIETANVELDEGFVHEHLGVTPGAYVMLSVSDTGSGMDRATQQRIFEPFFTTKEKGKGTGLGLAVVFGIVKQCNGSIWVYSEPGHGAVFKIYLPRTDEAPVAARPAPPIATLRGTETILVAEDEEQVRAVARTVLESQGYRVLVARNGVEALEVARAHPNDIDLVLTDVIMPKMGGRELGELVQQLRPSVKLLYMSGYTEDAFSTHEVLRDALLLEKPLTPGLLLRRVREALDRE